MSWEACLDPCARHVEVKSSHIGMSVNRNVYRVLADILEEAGWSARQFTSRLRQWLRDVREGMAED